MNLRVGYWIWICGLLLVFAACSGGEESASNQATNGVILEPLEGVDTTKPLITPAEEAAMAREVLIPYHENGRWGYADTAGKVVIAPRYEKVETFWNGALTVVKTGTGWGLVNKHGAEVVKPIQSEPIVDCGCGIFAFKQTHGYALVNKSGKRIDRRQVSDVTADCQEGLLPVKLGEAWGFIDSNGQPVIEADMDQVFPFYHGVAPVRKKGQKTWMVIDRNGKPVGTERFETLYPLTHGFGVGIQTDPRGDSKYGVIDSTGKVLIPFQFARIAGTFSGEYVACAAYDPYELEQKGLPTDANTWFIYDRTGKKVGETHYVLWDEFSEGLIVAEQEDKFGFVDPTGKVAIPFEYEWACAFKNGLAWVKKNGRYGFIDKKGKVVIPLQYDSAYDYVFMEDYGAKVVDPQTQEQFFIDRNGKEYRKQP